MPHEIIPVYTAVVSQFGHPYAPHATIVDYVLPTLHSVGSQPPVLYLWRVPKAAMMLPAWVQSNLCAECSTRILVYTSIRTLPLTLHLHLLPMGPHAHAGAPHLVQAGDKVTPVISTAV